MKTKTEIFMFIAKTLESIGQPAKDHNKTIYGITKKWYPQSYAILKDLILSKTPQTEIDKAIISAYNKIWIKSNAYVISGNLAYFYFGFYFNSEEAAVIALQRLIKKLYHSDIEVDGDLGPQTKGYMKIVTTTTDIFWFNFYRRAHYNTARRTWRNGLMNRVFALENYIYGNRGEND